VGATKRPAYRVIAIDRRRSRDGRALEILGYYDPLTEPATVQLDREKIQAWIGKGAQPSDTVVKLLRQAEAASARPDETEKPKRATRAAATGRRRAPASEAAPATAATSTDAPAADDAAGATTEATDADAEKVEA